jgi:hypothetical protein
LAPNPQITKSPFVGVMLPGWKDVGEPDAFPED